MIKYKKASYIWNSKNENKTKTKEIVKKEVKLKYQTNNILDLREMFEVKSSNAIALFRSRLIKDTD